MGLSTLRYALCFGIVSTLFLGGCNPPRKANEPPPQQAAPVAQEGPYENVAQRAGITFTYENGRKGIATILEESGSGCAFLDYDGDGWQDIYLLNGRDLYGRGIKSRNALYHNNRDGTFTDVTEKVGVPGTGYGIGVAAADFDNDGHTDLYISQWGKNCLYHNNGDGTFTDVTDKAKVGGLDYGNNFHTGAAWIDYDHDGKLDLFACSYVRFKLDGLRYCKIQNGVLSNCPPQVYDGSPSILYHNNGDGTFTNVTKEMGCYIPGGKALTAITGDVDDDGWTDLIVGNDGEQAWLLKNNKGKSFTDIAPAASIAFAHDGATMAAMGIDLGDFMNEGRMGFMVADFSKRPDHVWRNLGKGAFLEVSSQVGIADAGFPYLGFGAGFFDYDNDGWLDIVIANGHVYPEVEQPGADEHYLQRNQLFHNERNGTFREVTKEAGSGFEPLNAARGVAFGDIDNDGNLDLLVSNNAGAPLLLHHTGNAGRHFVNFKMIGTRSNRDAIGTRVHLYINNARQIREVKSGGSYLSSSDQRLHFGIDGATTITRLEIFWASGEKQIFTNIKADQFYRIREGSTAPEIIPIRRK
jgi:hypothetical protein